MRTVASDFAAETRRITAYVDLVIALFDMAKISLSGLRCKKSLRDAITDSHARARSLTLGDSLAFEGAYLSACALFEEAVRDIIDVCAGLIVAKKPAYADLPDKMKKAHLDGCISIIRSPKDVRFSRLSPPVVIARLATCYSAPAPTAYSLVMEVFSSHTSNFRSEVIADTVGRLGVVDLWTKLGADAALQAHFTTANAGDATRFATTRLNAIMTQRNQTIHRGAGFAAPTAAEVRECAAFFPVLIDALVTVLDGYVFSL